MSSVTDRIGEIKQPRGGYVKLSDFEVVRFGDGIVLGETENVHGSIVGMVVDYFTRMVLGESKLDAFGVCIKGAVRAEQFGMKKATRVAQKLLKGIKKCDNKSIVNACKLVSFDVWLRNPMAAAMAKDYTEINPDRITIANIQILIKRSIEFFDIYGPITKDGFTFEPDNPNMKEYEQMIASGKGSFGGYTCTVSSGDGDFLTEDTLWDFKVSKSKPTSKQTLQLLMYWIMGQHSGQKVFKSITKLGMFNPRENAVYLLPISKIPPEIIKTVEDEVICY